MSTTMNMSHQQAGAGQGAKKHDKEGDKKPSTRKYQYPPEGYVAPKGRLRVHCAETFSNYNRGRILQDLSLCVKPTTEPSNGCRAGRFGFYVWHEGVLRAAIWVLRQECDYIPHDTPIDEEMENEDAYAGESE